jgi:hypothetical protein|tara:strand:+ start:52 stop:522 length:471 start_codon:yes stop_codon:yes gene_type:complete
MKRTFITLIGLLFFNISFGQEIKMGMNLFGYKFEQNNKRLSWKELVSETESNIDANLLIKKAKSQNTISSILAFAGGGLIGIPIAQSITERESNWTLAYIGGGILAVGLPIAIISSKNVKKGIDLYNSSLNLTSNYFQPEFKIIANGNGLGLSMNF